MGSSSSAAADQYLGDGGNWLYPAISFLIAGLAGKSLSSVLDPLVKLLFANAGQRMANGPSVAATIGELAKRDPTLIGVVGLNESYRDTEATVYALAGHGIPTVAATASTDNFARDLPMYYQVAPQNIRQAAVAAAYAAQLTPGGAARSVRIYFSDDASDVYSSNLADDAQHAFRKLGFSVEKISFTPDGGTPPITPPARDRLSERGCGRRGFVRPFRDGLLRSSTLPDFGSFLSTVKNCLRPPRILASDNTTRYVANDLARRQYPSIPFDYVAFAVTLPTQANVSPEQDFYSSYGRLFPAQSDANVSLDGHAALAYDAAETLVTSARLLSSGSQRRPISPGTVWDGISSINAPGLRGASGYIDFGGRIDRHVPIDKPVLVLQVRNGEVQQSTENYCGLPPDQDPRTRPWCPHDPPPR